jgi:dephospho-CoA kinase
MTIVCLTGNYGMGKSTVAKMFSRLGAITIDTDMVVHKLLDDEDVVSEVKKAFGDDVEVDGRLNKRLISKAVFSYPHLRISLENILHPRVFREVDAKAAELARLNPYSILIVEAPVIFERGYQGRFDRIITVFTSEETALRRLADKGVSVDEARIRLNSQFPIEKKLAGSDFTIDNNDDMEHTLEQARHIYSELVASGSEHGNN